MEKALLFSRTFWVLWFWFVVFFFFPLCVLYTLFAAWRWFGNATSDKSQDDRSHLALLFSTDLGRASCGASFVKLANVLLQRTLFPLTYSFVSLQYPA